MGADPQRASPRIGRRAGILGRPRQALARHAALRWTAVAFLASRAYVVLVGALAYLELERGKGVEGIGLEPYGRLGDILTATSIRYDSGWYRAIATVGYGHDPLYAAFPPGYPLLMSAMTPLTRPFVGDDAGATLLAGLVISWAAFPVGLYLLYRLVRLDFDEQVARRTVILLAVFPTSFFFSAVYTESLFLALSVGSIYAARRGRWPVAGVLGALAAATRLQGLLLVIPLGLILLNGPQVVHTGLRWRAWRPRYSPVLLRRGAWIALTPIGLVAYGVYCWRALDDSLALLHAQSAGWGRHAVAPPVAAYLGLEDAAWAANQVRLDPRQLGDLSTRAPLTDAAFLVFIVAAVIGTIRRLPLAYGMYAVSALLLVLSSIPRTGREHLLSLPRIMLVVFPLLIWLALWARTPRRWWGTVTTSFLLLGFYSAVVATGRWVA